MQAPGIISNCWLMLKVNNFFYDEFNAEIDAVLNFLLRLDGYLVS